MNRWGKYLASFLTAATMLAASPQKANADFGEKGGRLFIGVGANFKKILEPKVARSSYEHSVSYGGCIGLVSGGYFLPSFYADKAEYRGKGDDLAARVEVLEIGGNLDVALSKADENRAVPCVGVGGGLAQVKSGNGEFSEKETRANLKFSASVIVPVADGSAFVGVRVGFNKIFTSDEPFGNFYGGVSLNFLMPKITMGAGSSYYPSSRF